MPGIFRTGRPWISRRVRRMFSRPLAIIMSLSLSRILPGRWILGVSWSMSCRAHRRLVTCRIWWRWLWVLDSLDSCTIGVGGERDNEKRRKRVLSGKGGVENVAYPRSFYLMNFLVRKKGSLLMILPGWLCCSLGCGWRMRIA